MPKGQRKIQNQSNQINWCVREGEKKSKQKCNADLLKHWTFGETRVTFIQPIPNTVIDGDAAAVAASFFQISLRLF